MLLENPERKCALYRYYGHDNELIYVGISFRPFARAEQHGYIRHESVARMDIQWCDNREDAEQAEAMAIATESPMCNKTGEIVDYNKWVLAASCHKWWPFDDSISNDAIKEWLAHIKSSCADGLLSKRYKRQHTDLWDGKCY